VPARPRARGAAPSHGTAAGQATGSNRDFPGGLRAAPIPPSTAPGKTGAGQARSPGWRAGSRRLGLGLLAVALVLIAGFAAPIVTAIPGLADLFQGDGLAFAGVKSSFLRVRGEDTILVVGELVNTTGHTVAVPAIRISLRDAEAEEVYAWLVEPAAAELDAGA
jgi:hypothetical protein